MPKIAGLKKVLVIRSGPIIIGQAAIRGQEVEVDAVGDGEDFFIPGIMEHIERAGVHSVDSIAVYPPQSLTTDVINRIVDYSPCWVSA